MKNDEIKTPLEQIANFLVDGKEKQVAVNLLKTMGKISPMYEQIDEVIKCLFKIKSYKEAAELYPKLLKAAPTEEHRLVGKSNMVNVFNHMNEPEKALSIIDELESKLEFSVDTQLEKAFSYFLINEKKKAELLLRQIRTRTDLTEEQKTTIDFNLGTYDMLNGELQSGLRHFLFDGEKLKFWNYKTFFNQAKDLVGDMTRWDGKIVPGLKLVIMAEAGIGDEIINVRFVKHLEDRGVEVVWMAMNDRKDLGDIFKNNGVRVIYSMDELEDKHTWLHSSASMHLPIWLNVQYSDLWKGPYLTKTDPLCDKKWQWIGQSSKPKIGLRWQGNPEYDHDLHRNIHLSDLVGSISFDAELFSLQRDSGIEENDKFPQVTNLSSQLLTLNDTMSIINQLDLVITSCTSIAHLANAMGKETCVLVPISAYYTWTQPGNKSHWYGENCHIFYQQKPRTWAEPIAELTEFLKGKYAS